MHFSFLYLVADSIYNKCVSLAIVNNTNFEKMLLRFYSGADMLPVSDNRCVSIYN